MTVSGKRKHPLRGWRRKGNQRDLGDSQIRREPEKGWCEVSQEGTFSRQTMANQFRWSRRFVIEGLVRDSQGDQNVPMVTVTTEHCFSLRESAVTPMTCFLFKVFFFFCQPQRNKIHRYKDQNSTSAADRLCCLCDQANLW